jgi:hypothetical protein
MQSKNQSMVETETRHHCPTLARGIDHPDASSGTVRRKNRSCLRRKLGLRDVFKMAAVASLLCGNVHSAVPTLSLIEGGVLLGAAMKERNENDKSV